MAKNEIKKQTFDYKAKYSTSTKYKEDAYYHCGDAFLNACGVPGPILGGINMFLGHSNGGKTTALLAAAADAQRKGHLPVFIITEKKWSWSHAKLIGVQAEKNEDGAWDGDFIFNDSFDYIEQATDFINEILDEQEKGNIPRSIAFLWDSIGSIPCKMTYDGKGGVQHNARVLADKIGQGISSRISKSKKFDYPYHNTLIICNQPWVDLPDNPFGQPEIKAKGGGAVWLAATYVFLFGNQKKAGINFIDATKDGRKVSFAIRTKISVLKDHDNGLSYKDGKVIAVPQGFIRDSKEALEQYKSEYSAYWKEKLGGNGDFEISEGVKDELEDFEE
jgi:hypothetical protein